MNIGTEAERARICSTLCELAGLKGFWSWRALEAASGPVFDDSGEPLASWRDYRCPLSSSEKLTLAFAWNLWNDSHRAATLADAMHVLDAEKREALADLLTLPTSAAWLSKWRPSWKVEPIEHYAVSTWQKPGPDEEPPEPYWQAEATHATLEAAQEQAERIDGRTRIERVSGRVAGLQSIELVSDSG